MSTLDLRRQATDSWEDALSTGFRLAVNSNRPLHGRLGFDSHSGKKKGGR